MSASLKQDHLKLPNESQPLLAAKRAISVEQDDESLELQNNESIKDDIVDILRLAFPIFLSSLSWVGKKTTDTALLGHVSQKALAASALSDLWTMTSQVLLNGRILGVLVGGAIGAGNKILAGVYLQVSYVVLFAVSIIVIIAWSLTEQVWLWYGSDAEISHMAGYYAIALSTAIPGIVAFQQLAQFFSAQRIMHPEVNTSAFGLLANLVFGLIFVLGWPIPGFQGYGFEACPLVTSTVTYLQLGFILYVYVYKQQLHASCWPGWKKSEITWPRVKMFCDLYFPSALSSASDFWRVAVIGGVAAKLGEPEVAVFNTAYRIMWIALIFVGALAGASAINMSIRLGKKDPFGARQAGYVGIALAFIMLLFLGAFIVYRSRWFGMIFTSDAVFLALFEEASLPFTITLFFMNLSVAIERIPYSMGRTKEVFWMGFVASWGGQVPAVFVFTKYWRNDLVGLYTGMAVGYFLLTILYSIIAYRSDWVKYSEIAQMRSESSDTKSPSAEIQNTESSRDP